MKVIGFTHKSMLKIKFSLHSVIQSFSHSIIQFKYSGFSLLMFFFLLNTSYKPIPKRIYGIKTVVIDAGHGGHDVGCLGSSAKEKNIALSVSLKLGQMIEEKFPDVHVIYTRKKDEFVELHERAGIANRAKADLFICIHCNSGAPAAYGPETYVMGLHKTAENLAVARRENSSVLLEKDYKTKYDGFDPNSAEANIIFTLFQNAFMNQSIAFASKIQNEFEEYSGRNNRGVKQAGFLVLYRTTMPSVLIETGFLTNKNEEKYLLSEKGQTDVAASIFKAFKEYKIDMEGETFPDATDKAIKQDTGSDNEVKQKKADTLKNVSNPENVLASSKKTSAVLKTKDSLVNKNTTYPLPENKLEEPKRDSVIKETAIPEKIISKKSNETKTNSPVNSIDNLNSAFFYTVQIGVMSEGTKGVEKFNDVIGLKKIKSEDGMTHFTIGNFQNLNDAINMQSKMRSQDFKDAFVTAYKDNKRISLKEAAEFLKKN
jgi:N-acetylmuramoyl-L-alanine amidase